MCIRDRPETEEAEADEAAAELAAELAVAEKAQRARARVIKIRRADATPLAEDSATAPAPEAPADPAIAARAPGADRDEDIARLLRQADDEMSEPENRRRLSAIQHLKAAVAATVAERRAGVKEPSDEERADPYREDLARAVRPIRPRAPEGVRNTARPAPLPDGSAADAGAPAAPSGGRPAPLVLVSEQRIDRVAPARVTPSRPRRVGGGAAAAVAIDPGGFEAYADADLEAELEAAKRSEDLAEAIHEEAADETRDVEIAVVGLSDEEADALAIALSDDSDADDRDTDDSGADEVSAEDSVEEDDDAADDDTDNIFADSKGFAEFADRLGATGLPDLLEAAAAYATCIENREHFTRPLLMRRLEAGHMGDGVSREEGLRSFGTLLREGRIEKVRRGQYALPGDSACLAEARRISG